MSLNMRKPYSLGFRNEELFKFIDYESAELIKLILSIAEDCQDEGETVEESLFKSLTHVTVESINRGASPHSTADAMEEYFKGTEYELASIVFAQYLNHVGVEMLRQTMRQGMSELERRFKGANNAKIRHAETNKIKQEARKKYASEKAEYKGQIDFARIFRQSLINEKGMTAEAAPKATTIARWLKGI